ncbi:hypothetical protein HYPSUDRAFT_86634 [Hypholoma sublateritium FD-334 SS-4]|uniref:Uncharacterized protein n=1 Tax=Hypholoma sublateritium (strain FD-334 SS-4) TaxID=945553 RepID=A0A0D2L8G5_HYPSF|nr:hypothetical protein HYPSUDRAFT_86634 [Hypholoma sublateritium FD-334 SS-4]
MSAQMSTQTANYPAAFENPRFSFLAKPPPPKRRQVAPLPPPPGSPPPAPYGQTGRKFSNVNSSILAWATHVQPGSPAPRSPHRRLSITSNSSRRSSISRMSRRPSISHNRAASGSSIMHIIDAAPVRTPSTGKFDLTTLGYASVFIQFPKTPTTPSPYLREYHLKRGGDPAAPLSSPPRPLTAGPLSAQAFASIPLPPIPQDAAARKPKGMKRFRSLSILRPRSTKGKSQAGPASPLPHSPTKMSASASVKAAQAARKQQLAAAAAAVSQRKHTKYAASKSVVRAPPPLANELALMQFADGGSIEAHARRVMEAQALAAQGHTAQSVGVAAVHRDAQGGLWWDADEEMEYAPLLDVADDGAAEADWEEFDGDALSPLTGSPRRTPTTALRARTSISTQASELDPARLLPLPELEDPRAADDRALASHRIGGPGMSVLALPARPRRAVPHLRAAPTFLVDVAAFIPRSPGATASSSSRTSPKVRRRPAPLKLASSAHTVRTRRAVVPLPAAVPAAPAIVRAVPSIDAVARARHEFLQDSFAPAPAPSAAPTSILIGVDSVPDPREERATKRKGVRGLFGLGRRSQ